MLELLHPTFSMKVNDREMRPGTYTGTKLMKKASCPWGCMTTQSGNQALGPFARQGWAAKSEGQTLEWNPGRGSE